MMENNYMDYIQKDFYSIGEVCAKLNSEVHTLRYIEKVVKLNIKRNERLERIYTPKDIDTFKFILDMKDKGFNYSAIKEILDHQKEEAAADVITNEEIHETNDTCTNLTVKNDQIDGFVELMGNLIEDKIEPIHQELSDLKNQNLKLQDAIEKQQERHFKQIDQKITRWREENVSSKPEKKSSLFSKMFKKSKAKETV